MDTQSSKFKLRLGLFVATGIVVFLAAVFLIGRQKNLFNPVFNLTTNFSSVSGLQVGNNVRFSGINVGTVDMIKIINDSTVKVDMIIQKDVQRFVKEDSEASIGSEGIIGDRVLIISQGSSSSPSVKGGQSLTSIETVELDDIIASLYVSTLNAEVISEQLAEIMININQGNGTLGMLIQDTVIAKNLKQSVVGIKNSSIGLNQNMEALKSNFLFRGYFKRKAKKAEKQKQKQN